MFGVQFFPTPRPVVDLMVEPYRDRIKAGALVLEPSAGKGNILDTLKSIAGSRDNLYAIEIDPDLQAILRGKEYQVIGDDFLKYTGRHLFDLVVMNPPFASAEDHLLKAWEILRGGDVVCLLNEQSLLNPNTTKRELLAQLVRDHGSVEYLGSCFDDAERKTGVRVALVRMTKVARQDDTFTFTFNHRDRTDRPTAQLDETQLGSQVARADFITSLVDSFDASLRAYTEYVAARDKLHFYTGTFTTAYNTLEDLLKQTYQLARYKDHIDVHQRHRVTFNAFVQVLGKHAWHTVFDKTKVSAVLTEKQRQNFDAFQKEQGGVDFSVENIHALFDMLFLNRGQIMHDCLVEVFDKLTSYDAKNRVHWEGWKTNSAHKVNRKVIMPWFVEFDHKYCQTYQVRYHNRGTLDDIDKVLCMLTGKKLQGDGNGNPGITTIYEALDRKFSILNSRRRGGIQPGDQYDNTCSSEFFDLKFWKKGTLHMVFRDTWVWDEFNRAAAKGKNWLPAEK